MTCLLGTSELAPMKQDRVYATERYKVSPKLATWYHLSQWSLDVIGRFSIRDFANLDSFQGIFRPSIFEKLLAHFLGCASSAFTRISK
jgi:hypothetical protein